MSCTCGRDGWFSPPEPDCPEHGIRGRRNLDYQRGLEDAKRLERKTITGANLKQHEVDKTVQARYDAARARIEARGWRLGGQGNYPENLFTPEGRRVEVPDCADSEAEIAMLEHWARTIEETNT